MRSIAVSAISYDKPADGISPGAVVLAARTPSGGVGGGCVIPTEGISPASVDVEMMHASDIAITKRLIGFSF